MRRIILIGGAPTVGKSTLARSLSKKLDLPWISTDHLRTVMRAVANPLDLPKLFTPESHSAEAFFDKFSAQEVVQIELDQGEAAWPGICEFIKLDYCWSEGFIIEGVNILPHLVAKNFKDSKEVKAVFLVDGDRERTRDIIFTRGLWDDADKYPDYVKEKELEWAILFDKKIRELAKEFKFPTVEISKSESDLKKVLTALNLD